ncbi:hypothetical protein FH972_025643 [Carpinus fangiana]|uniref:ribonuclease Z n=1 Tax=Carpinus fangiana TaxID=176857 RepID=A0A5N6L215_9ROSI|nr:hypothetical protein FH972_025643 [Carpinus fangiana]
MKCWLEFIHTPSLDVPGTLCFLHFDERRYLIGNLSEGPNFGLLSKGHSVQNTRGETITSDMVLEPGTLGTGFAFIDIPSVAYIDELLSRPEWRNQDVMEGVIAMIWNIGPTVADDTRILQFQNEFTTLQHIISAQDKSPDDFVLESAVKQDMRNHKLAPETFPMIRHDTSKGIIPSSFSVPGKLSLKYRPTKKVHREEALSTSHKMAQRGLRLVLEPRVEFEVDGLKPVYDPVHMMRETEEDVKDFGLPSQSEDVMVDSDVQFRWERAVPWTKAEVLCLGTGSSHPGEGTLGTLRRMYSPEELNGVLRDLRMIWISHLHADHHLGITSVIKAWYQATHNSVPADISSSRAGPSLCIVSDVHMLDWLQEYSHVEDFGFSRITCVATVPSHMGGLSLYSGNVPGTSTFVQPPGRESPPLYDSSRLVAQDLRQAMSLRYLQAALVNHCHGAQAVSFTTRAGLKVSYSGDCRPSFKFADIGKGSHVLIHEATFEEDMRDEAMAKKHSTAGEALLVAAQMQAKSVILTHFSQRYPKMSAFNTSHKLPIATDKATTNAASTRSTPPPTSPAGSRRNSNPNSGRPSSPGEAYASLIKPTGSLGPLLAANPNMRVVMAFDYMRLQLGNIPRFEAQQPRMRALYDALSAAAEAGHEDGPHEDDENANNSEAHLRRQRSRSASSENSKQRQHHGKLPGSSPARSEKRARTDSGERTG